MKKYRVSLALKVPANFETEIEAGTKKQALEIALKRYSNGDFDETNISDADWANAELGISESDNIDALGSGIFIEEI